MNPGLQDFGPMNYLRRTDSKDSSCTSLSSASHMHDRALTASMSVPAVAFGVSIYLEALMYEILVVCLFLGSLFKERFVLEQI